MTTDWNYDAATRAFERIDGPLRLTVKRFLDMAPKGNRWGWTVVPHSGPGRAKAGLALTWEAGMFAAGDAAALMRAGVARVKHWNLDARPKRLPLLLVLALAPVALLVQAGQALLRCSAKRPSSAAIDAANDVLASGGRQ